MAERSNISWTDATFNAWTGCQHAGPGCDNCYAEAWAKRAGRDFAVRTRTTEPNWKLPEKWNRSTWFECLGCGSRFSSNRRGLKDGIVTCAGCRCDRMKIVRPRVFCSSLADVFDNQVPELWRAELWELIARTPNLDWIILTKRVGNVMKMIPRNWAVGTMPRHIWLIATICNQQEADRDIVKLLQVPARVRGISVEPMLGPVSLDYWPIYGEDEQPLLHWVIVGGESGGKRRPMQIEWARDLIRQCKDAAVPVFVKQDNGLRPGAQGRFTDAEWAIKEFP